MDKFLETYNLSRLNHEEIENLNRIITSEKVESVIKSLPKEKSSGPYGSLVNSTEHLYILLKLFQTIEEVGTLPNSF